MGGTGGAWSLRLARVSRSACIGAGVLLCATLPGSVVARTVEYLAELTAIRAAASDQGIEGPFSQAPGPGGPAIALETPMSADHRVIVASIYCQAYHVENPVSGLLRDLVAGANRVDGAASTAPQAPAVTLRIVSGSTVLRCMGKSDIETICKNRVRLVAEASFVRADGTPGNVPLVAQVEREGRVGGFCGNIARYTGIVTREAGIKLINDARSLGRPK